MGIVRPVLWPVITLLVIGSTHLLAEAIRPALHEVIGPAVVMPIYLAVGAWVALDTARHGRGFVGGLVSAVALGILPVLLQLIGFGTILGRASDEVVNSALFGLFALTWGGAIGAGIGASLTARSAEVGSALLSGDSARAQASR